MVGGRRSRTLHAPASARAASSPASCRPPPPAPGPALARHCAQCTYKCKQARRLHNVNHSQEQARWCEVRTGLDWGGAIPWLCSCSALVRQGPGRLPRAMISLGFYIHTKTNMPSCFHPLPPCPCPQVLTKAATSTASSNIRQPRGRLHLAVSAGLFGASGLVWRQCLQSGSAAG